MVFYQNKFKKRVCFIWTTLYINKSSNNILGIVLFSSFPSPHSVRPSSSMAKEAWHWSKGLSQLWAAGIWWSSPQFSCTLAAPVPSPLPLLILPFLPRPVPEHNGGALCGELKHTHRWAYRHIHTFAHHWKRQEQRRKEEQTPLRCWTWLRVPLDSDGCTQDNCCLLFMVGPSATLGALFICRLLNGHSQKPHGEKWKFM